MLPDLTIVLTEDSADDAFFFRRALARAGVPAKLVYTATEGGQIIEYLRGNKNPPPDVLFLDLKMPNQNGFDVLQWLRQNPALAKIKVVVLTSSIDAKDRETALQLGAAAFFTKPITADQLREVLKA